MRGGVVRGDVVMGKVVRGGVVRSEVVRSGVMRDGVMRGGVVRGGPDVVALGGVVILGGTEGGIVILNEGVVFSGGGVVVSVGGVVVSLGGVTRETRQQYSFPHSFLDLPVPIKVSGSVLSARLTILPLVPMGNLLRPNTSAESPPAHVVLTSPFLTEQPGSGQFVMLQKKIYQLQKLISVSQP